MKSKKRRRSLQSVTVMLAVITALIWLVMVFIKLITRGLSFDNLFDDILSNILGILPPIIIFNFAYEYMTKQYMTDEVTEQITQTLMSNPETIDLFHTENKINFIRTTMTSIVGEESKDMVYGVIEPYLTNSYNIREFYKYTITLREYAGSEIFKSDSYFRVYENLKFRKRYVNKAQLTENFHVGFFLTNIEIDKAFRDCNFIFRENLLLKPSEIDYLNGLDDDARADFIENEMALAVYINDSKCKATAFNITESGIDVEFHSSDFISDKANQVEISFNMPQLKGHSEFLVSINEPTYSPIIQLSYPEDIMQVKAFTFINDGEDSLVEKANHYAGGYEFCIQDKWVYPMSGVVFVID